MSIKRAFYSASISQFIEQSHTEILGRLSLHSAFDDTLGQKQAWLVQIQLLQKALKTHPNGHILLEYTIPRMGRRIDAVLILSDVLVIVEFKVGSTSFDRHAINQVMDYALDLKYFHAESEPIQIVPVVVATLASQSRMKLESFSEDGIANVLCVAPGDLECVIGSLTTLQIGPEIDASRWIASEYRPTPTIIEAAQVLFQGHGVEEISRSDASAVNLAVTAAAVNRIIDESKRDHRKSICLITGVPGAGKTLAGLAVANARQQYDEEEHAVFLSGNGPLVAVLREALARDESTRRKQPKSHSLTRARAFIQNIHHFRDDALQTTHAPHEKVTVFDEAQRAWDSKQLSKFMNSKRGIHGFDQSEPEFLIEVMDRHQDWAVIVCLVGEGQDIHDGEAGIAPWIYALQDRFSDWQVFATPRISLNTTAGSKDLENALRQLGPDRVHFDEALHLDVSIRSFRSEKLSAFVEQLLLGDAAVASQIYDQIRDMYPIRITRSLQSAREWVRQQARGTERYGLTASSRAKRLRPLGIWVDFPADPPVWFLNDESDVRSSFGLEVAATEFDVQGLELDWNIIAWDGDFRHNSREFEHWEFRGRAWNQIRDDNRRRYLINAYRVLLTRARQGMVIFVPEGDKHDPTRDPKFYSHTYSYLKSIGILEI